MQIISVLLLSSMLIAERSDAISDGNKEKLTKMFSPILILTEENSTEYDPKEDIRIT